jgi:hypothetical protein
MSGELRLWLLGVEPEGPPLRDDPLYRYEARRHWTPKRYALTALALVVWMAAVAFWLAGDMLAGEGRDFAMMFTVWLALLGRMPLTFVASTGAALCIAPERSSGQLEQFILTPVDSWRFCLARLAGRLRGLLVIGLCLMPVLLGIAVLIALDSWRMQPQSWGPLRTWGTGDLFLPAVIIAFGLIDLPAMLLVDAAVGMRFTAASSHTALALVKTYLVNFLLTPASMFLGASLGFFAGLILVRMLGGGNGGGSDALAMTVVGITTLATRLGLAAIAVRLALRDARVAIQKTFYEPGEPS